jgi:hypothetical protein
MEEKLEPFWAIVEVKGFVVYAGLISETTFAGSGFIRVDVPAVSPNRPAFSKLISPTSIHCITPTDEESARLTALRIAVPAIPATLARLTTGNGEW